MNIIVHSQINFRQWILLALFSLILTSNGCSIFPWKNRKVSLPKILPESAMAQDILSAVNANSSQMRSFVTNNAKIHISSSPIPLSNCKLAFERQKKFRAMGSSAVTGPLFDIGSNDELFWVWTKSGQENAIYFCRHSQYATCPARSVIPIDPDWLVESMGVVDFKPGEQHELMPTTPGGNYVIQTLRPTATGTFKKMTTIDRNTACVLSQSLYGPNNQLVAKADSPEHLIDATSNIVYPKSVEMTFITAGETFKIQIDLGTVQYNITEPFSRGAFSLPTYAGYTAVDICSPQFNANQAAQSVPVDFQQSVMTPIQ